MRSGVAHQWLSGALLALLLLGLAACASTAQRPSSISSPCAGGDCAAGSGVSGVQLFVEPKAKEAPVLAAIRGAAHSIWIELSAPRNG
ncbi:MAG TPA: hypothetical protein VHR15_19125 [Ktedonobacterales bacterium]|jgi:phosphatidylserine/phosphatidylglycerophosphate/cardiolipin synthase-like enzyme|nr:hypothetical protein [Ktedonobacterales bacterium]